MTEFRSLSAPLPHIPDDLTIPQFIFSTQSVNRPNRPDKVPWLIDDHSGRAVGRVELVQRTRSLANGLNHRWNIKTGQTVCIFSPNNIYYPLCIWAVHSLGCVVTPANPAYKAEELAHQLQTSKATLLITHPSVVGTAQVAARTAGIAEDRIVLIESHPHLTTNYPTVDELVSYGSKLPIGYTESQFQPGEAKKALAFLSFSSGTTGKPKAVAISHYAVIANVVQTIAHFKLDDPILKDKLMAPGDVAIAVLPFFHIYGLVVNMHFLLFAGLSVVVVPKFHFPTFLESIFRHKITHLLVVPPQVVLLCKHPTVKNFDFSHVKYCMSGAAPLSGELVRSLRQILPNAIIGQGYGLTETCASVALMPNAIVGSAGRLLPGIVARVVKSDGSLALEGEQGELVVTGPSMALGYQNNDAATKETFVNGWVHTGDEVVIRNGELFIVDRLKEILKVRGYQVAPAELEGHLLTHSDVVGACVVSVPDDYSGELPLAYIVLSNEAARRVKGNPHATAQVKKQLAKYVADAKVNYKHLAGGIEFIDEIPKSPSGKILRRVLRDHAKGARASNHEQRAKL